MKQITVKQSSLGKLMDDIRKVELLTIQEEIELTTKIKEYQVFLIKVKTIKEELTVQLGRLITAIDIAEKLGVSVHEYNKIHKIGNLNRNKLIEANIRLVISIAKKYTATNTNKYMNINLNDLIQEGVFGLVKAAEKFEPSKGFKFSTYGCVPIDTQILTKRGWLNYKEIKPTDYTIGYNLETKETEWTQIEKITEYKDAPLLSIGDDRWNTICTPGHKWLVKDLEGVRLRPIEEWSSDTKMNLVLSSNFTGGDSLITDDEAELLSWVFSDPFINISNENQDISIQKGHIFYNEDTLSDELNTFINRLNNNFHKFEVSMDVLHTLWNKANLYNYSLIELVLSFSPSARKVYNDTWYKATALKGRNYIVYLTGEKLDAIEVSLFLEGKNCLNKKITDNSYSVINWRENLLNSDKCKVTSLVEKEDVWCPSTDLGTWTARDRNGNIFLTGNTWWIKQSISKFVSENTKPIKIPIHISDLINKIKYTSKELEIRKGRPASEKEIANELGITVKRIRKAVEVSKPIISLDFSYSDQQDTTITTTLVERVKSPDMGPESSIEKEDLLRIIDILLEELDEVDAAILNYRFGLKGTKLTITELAEKYSISKEIVRKKEHLAIKYLKSRSVELIDFI